MVFSTDGPAVNAYANKFYRQMEPYIIETSAPENREREFVLHPECYPDPVSDVLLNVEHVTGSSSKTHVVYQEDWSGDRWTCRWGRHENDHNSRDHFHHPPTPEGNEDPYAYDAELGQGVLLMETPINFILDRMNDLATADEHTYPSNYEWQLEYQQGKYSRP